MVVRFCVLVLEIYGGRRKKYICFYSAENSGYVAGRQ